MDEKKINQYKIYNSPRHIITDHMGNTFSSKKELCEAYGINYNTYISRERCGWPQKKIFEGKICNKSSNAITDHLGNQFASKKEMCETYNIPYSTYISRIQHGWTQKEALTFATYASPQNIITDHLGNEFTSIKEMCKHYNTTYITYLKRIKKGWTQESALTASPYYHYNVHVTDYLGNQFTSIKEMCKHYNVSPDVYSKRIKNGWTQEKALTKDKSVTDHLGNQFTSIKEMCEYYNITYAMYYNKIHKGYALEEILTTNSQKRQVKLVIGHLGNQFTSTKKMCEHYNINYKTYMSRIFRGWTLEEALIMQNRKKEQI